MGAATSEWEIMEDVLMDDHVYLVSFGTNQWMLNSVDDAVVLLKLLAKAQPVFETFQGGEFVIQHSNMDGKPELKVRNVSDIDGEHL
ncbi:hypothetical protein [Endozoicomonas atrinae]|uniref:hypothetical protein n=1 Tax=Endozoicomonas atrinae TaxID=1333660 RepID=UPI003B00BD52